MAAAPEALFEEARPVFETLGGRIFHVGSRPGQGAAMKTLNELLCGVHLAAAAEALAFACGMGVDAEVALRDPRWLLGRELDARRPRSTHARGRNLTVTSAVDIFVKDLGIVAGGWTRNASPLPLAAVAHQMFVATSGCGKGGADDSQADPNVPLTGRSS